MGSNSAILYRASTGSLLHVVVKETMGEKAWRIALVITKMKDQGWELHELLDPVDITPAIHSIIDVLQ